MNEYEYIGMTIAICTRNRPNDLIRCIRSIVEQTVFSGELEVLVVDDGNLPDSFVQIFRDMIQEKASLRYYKKVRHGLLSSRIEAIALAKYNIILFLDDDVEIGRDYISKLKQTYTEFPQLVGIGGIDVLLKPSGLFSSLYNQLFCFNSGRPGKLSASGYGGSMMYWNSLRDLFNTEFLSGCNMSFKKEALGNVELVDWLEGYSLGEDLYLSYIAKQYGPLLVNPSLKVKHHQSSVARDSLKKVAFAEIRNHYHLLRINGISEYRQLIQCWTCIGLCGRALFKGNFVRLFGYFDGLMFLLANIIKLPTRKT